MVLFLAVFFALSSRDSTGNAGNIDLQTGSLAIADGAIISAQTEGTGGGGTIAVEASQSVFLND